MAAEQSPQGNVWLALGTVGFAWHAPTAAFSAIYVFPYGRSVWGALAHGALTATVALSAIAVVLLCFSLTTRHRALLWAAGAATGIWIAALLFFYGVVLTGLMSWGRVPTLALMSTYVAQLGPLLRALDLSPVVVGTSVAMLALVAVLVSSLATRNAWAVLARAASGRSSSLQRAPRRPAILLALAVFAASGFQMWSELVFFPAVPAKDEPWNLVFQRGPADPEGIHSMYFERIGDRRRQAAELAAERAYQTVRSFRRRNIVLITVDALRPDHLGVYGYVRDTTPYLSSLASKGLLTKVDEARSSCAESACGLLSLLTGKEPHELLSRNFGLLEVLSLHGYRRWLILGGDHTNFYRLKDFYGPVEHYSDGAGLAARYANDDYELIERVRELPDAPGDEPQFLYFHLMSVHGIGTRHDRHIAWKPARSLYHPATMVDDEGLSQARNFYDNGVLQADWVISQLMLLLEQKGYVDKNSIVLVTADHGESLGEHGFRGHSATLFEVVLRIPWLWLGRPPSAQMRDSLVVQADFAPTVLQALGIPAPPHWSGVPLQVNLRDRQTYHLQPPEGALVRAAGAHRVKLVQNFRKGSTVVFDLSADPRELDGRSLLAGDPATHGMLEALIRAGFGELGQHRR